MSSDLQITPLTAPDDIDWSAALMSRTEPWVTLRRDYTASRNLLLNPDRECYIAHISGQRCGFLILALKGATVGHLQTICLAPEFRDRGFGTRIIAFAEERIFRDFPNVFLSVSSFNPKARRLYERLGYHVVGELADYIVPSHSEILLRKTIGPMADFHNS